MLSHNRPGLTRGKTILIIVSGLAAILAIVVIIESQSYFSLLKQGAIDTLDDLNYNDRFTIGKKPETKANTVVDVSSAASPSVGNASAPIQAVEFVDFSCSYSKDESTVIRELVSSRPDLIRLTVRNFPLDDLHPDARLAALAAMCADEQGKYWAMYDALFANQAADGSFKAVDLRRYAIGAGADGEKYDACMASAAGAPKIQADIDAGTAAGVAGTPTFFVNGYKIDGAIPAEIWRKILSLSK
jgi:protein-disulfide isomerase